METTLDLSRITYMGVVLRKEVAENNSIKKILEIGHKTSQNIKFYDKIIYTAQPPECETYDFKIVEIEPLEYGNYTDWLFSNYGNKFESDFVMNFHGDGMIQNPSAWTDEFLDYDYTGAPWPASWGMTNGGNGGFSLRSRKLCELVSALYLPVRKDRVDRRDSDTLKKTLTTVIEIMGGVRGSGRLNDPLTWESAEDYLICVSLEGYLKERGIKFCPAELSFQFSTERVAMTCDNFFKSFGFHEIKALSDENATAGGFVFTKDNPEATGKTLAKQVQKHRERFLEKIFENEKN